jgi:hypothetical protein
MAAHFPAMLGPLPADASAVNMDKPATQAASKIGG